MKKIDINKAWNRIHNRLESENLLLQKDSRKIPIIPWAAAITFLLISSVLVYQLIHKNNEVMLTVENTTKGKILVTTLGDGSTVFLEHKALLNYPDSFSSSRRTVQLEGVALFDISKDAKRPFVIETAHASIEVLGTSFSIHSIDNEASFSLSVQEGKVKIKQKGNPNPMYAVGGESVRLNGKQLKKSTIVDNHAFDHYTENMRFKDQTLGDVLKTIGKVTGYTFVLTDSQLGSRRLTVTFDNKSVNSMTELICLAMSLNYKEQQDNTIIITTK